MWMGWIFLTGIVIGAAYVSPYFLRLTEERRLRARCGREHLLVLTYDDGPGPVTTSQLLDALKERGAKATFFLLGQRLQSAPDVLDRMQADGHELASHSYAHLNAWKSAPWSSLFDVRQGFEVLTRHGIHFRLFRPPYGKVNLLTWAAAVGRGLQFGWWTVDSGDTWQALPDPEPVANAIERNGGGIVLMHDFDRGEERATYVVNLTNRLLEIAFANGWTVCTYSQLLQS